VIGLMLYYIFKEPAALWFIMITVAFGEFVVVLAGTMLFAGIEKTNKKVIDLLKN